MVEFAISRWPMDVSFQAAVQDLDFFVFKNVVLRDCEEHRRLGRSISWLAASRHLEHFDYVERIMIEGSLLPRFRKPGLTERQQFALWADAIQNHHRRRSWRHAIEGNQNGSPILAVPRGWKRGLIVEVKRLP